jgi:hypothetical protein
MKKYAKKLDKQDIKKTTKIWHEDQQVNSNGSMPKNGQEKRKDVKNKSS